MADLSRLEGIRAEATIVAGTVRYLNEFPQDIKSQKERLCMQRQYLLDVIDELLPDGDSNG